MHRSCQSRLIALQWRSADRWVEKPPNGAQLSRGRGRVLSIGTDAGAVAIRALPRTTPIRPEWIIRPSVMGDLAPRSAPARSSWVQAFFESAPRAIRLDKTDALFGPVPNAGIPGRW
jgi:hypothetical protein